MDSLSQDISSGTKHIVRLDYYILNCSILDNKVNFCSLTFLIFCWNSYSTNSQKVEFLVNLRLFFMTLYPNLPVKTTSPSSLFVFQGFPICKYILSHRDGHPVESLLWNPLLNVENKETGHNKIHNTFLQIQISWRFVFVL